MLRDIPGFLAILLFSLLVSVSVNWFSPKGIALKGQWDKTKGVVFARGKAQAVSSEREIRNPLEVKKIVDEGSMMILDLRPGFIYEEGHIPGALSYPLADFDQVIEEFCRKFDKETPMLLYCAGVFCTDSHTAASRLALLGFSQLKVFTGGFQEWQEMEFPIEISEKSDESGK